VVIPDRGKRTGFYPVLFAWGRPDREDPRRPQERLLSAYKSGEMLRENGRVYSVGFFPGRSVRGAGNGKLHLADGCQSSIQSVNAVTAIIMSGVLQRVGGDFACRDSLAN